MISYVCYASKIIDIFGKQYVKNTMAWKKKTHTYKNCEHFVMWYFCVLLCFDSVSFFDEQLKALINKICFDC